MSLDLSSLLAQAPLRKPRRPVAERMLSLQVRDVRPLVEVHQQTVRLPQMGDSLSLLWRWRSGGCLGPQAAAAMNARQRQPREDRPAAEPQLDRGATGGWHLDLVCPVCAKPCRKLFAPSWSERVRPAARIWACRRCHRVTYESSNRPGSSNGRRPPSYRYRKHEEAALKIRKDFMGVTPEELHLPNLFLAWKPHGSTLHWERWEALRQLCLAHETLSMAAWSEAIHRRALQVGVDDPAPDHQLEISRARELLKENAWAARQSSWHRRGLPRPGPCKRHLTGGRLEKRPLGMTQPPTPNPQDGAKILGAVVSLGVFLYVGYMFYGGGVEKEAAETMRTIEQQVATDSEAQYNITKQSGTAIDRGGAEEAGGPTRPTTGLF